MCWGAVTAASPSRSDAGGRAPRSLRDTWFSVLVWLVAVVRIFSSFPRGRKGTVKRWSNYACAHRCAGSGRAGTSLTAHQGVSRIPWGKEVPG